MIMTKISFLSSLFILAFTALVHAQGGKLYSTSDCASGDGPDYYFFNDGKVVTKDGDGHGFRLGKWEASGQDIKITYSVAKCIKPAPDAKMTDQSSNSPSYDSYIAANDTESLKKPETVSLPTENEGCERVEKHNKTNAEEFFGSLLRNGGKGKREYEFASKRLLTANELSTYTPLDLEIMRNEIYASYGYEFKKQTLKTHFKDQGFMGYLTNVDAFLSEIEVKNIIIIKQVEQSKK